jgi:dTDP-4-dehydrorhamnose 3,5-epimerase
MVHVEASKLDGVFLVKPAIFEDFRGSYTMTYSHKEYNEAFLKHGLEEMSFVEDDISTSQKNVLRGIHGDNNTSKLVSCLEGRFYLVIVNNIPSHPQYKQWVSYTLSEFNRWQVLIPAGFGNGHLVMSERAIFCYKQTSYYNPKGQFTLLWNDPQLNIWWPNVTPVLSERDQFGTPLD